MKMYIRNSFLLRISIRSEKKVNRTGLPTYELSFLSASDQSVICIVKIVCEKSEYFVSEESLREPHGVWHYDDVIMTTITSQITSLTSVYSTVYSHVDQRKHQSSASLAFVWGSHQDRWIPRTKGQLRGKCFHLMTSSWIIHGQPPIPWLLVMMSFKCNILHRYELRPRVCDSLNRTGTCLEITRVTLQAAWLMPIDIAFTVMVSWYENDFWFLISSHLWRKPPFISESASLRASDPELLIRVIWDTMTLKWRHWNAQRS